MSQFEMSILGIWGRITPEEIVESFDGDPNVGLFLAEVGVKARVIPKSRYTEFAEWACFEFPGEYRKVES
jgi:hypothetical protein